MHIFFRTDASLEIGTGHVTRCLTLARALREGGAVCRFICREHPGNLLEGIRQADFEVFALPRRDYSGGCEFGTAVSHSRWLGEDWQTDAAQSIAVLQNYQVDWLVVDHYALDYQWEAELRPYCWGIMVIDDLADRRHNCELLLDQNLIVNQEHRYDKLLPRSCLRLIGPSFALLQPDYSELHSQTAPRVGRTQRIMVFFGGSDNQNLTGRTIAAFLSLERTDITLDVVIAPSNPHKASLKTQVESYNNIYFYEGLPCLAKLMVQADLAIGAGGATSWERCCLGLFSLIITVADNQRPIADFLDKKNLARNLGHYDTVTKEDIAKEIEEMLLLDSLENYSLECAKVTDGKGTSRVKDIMVNLMCNDPLAGNQLK